MLENSGSSGLCLFVATAPTGERIDIALMKTR